MLKKIQLHLKGKLLGRVVIDSELFFTVHSAIMGSLKYSTMDNGDKWCYGRSEGSDNYSDSQFRHGGGINDEKERFKLLGLLKLNLEDI